MTSSLASTLPNLAAFCRTFTAGSFTGAARALGVTPQAVSRSVARLEQELGVTLFRRTTRSLAPTDEARRYYERCVEALALLASAERELTSEGAPEGEVKLSIPTTYGHHRFLPSLGLFRERYPKIRVAVSVSNQNIDFVRDGFDLAIRMGTIGEQGLVARKLGDFALGVFASPAYLERHPPPRTVEELARHTCIGFILPSTGRVLPWGFAKAPQTFAPNAPYRVADDVLGVVGLARAGIGLIQLYDFIVQDDVARGALVEVLRPYRGKTRPFSLLRPKSVAPTPAVRAMIDFIVELSRA